MFNLSRVSLRFLGVALLALPLLFSSCGDDDKGGPVAGSGSSGDNGSLGEASDSVSAIDLLRADDSKDLVVTGNAYGITKDEAFLPFKLNVPRGNLSYSHYGVILSDDPTAKLAVGEEITTITSGSDIYDLDYLILVIDAKDLRPNTVYRYVPYYCYSGPYSYGEVKNFTTLVSDVISCTPVDLGLSVCWSAQNLGASLDFQRGLYFSYADTSAFAHPIKPDQCPKGNVVGSKLDPATHLLGDGWSSPTQAQIRELINNCTWTQDVRNGYKVFKVTGPNGHVLYFPLTGYYIGEGDNLQTERVYLWSGEQNSDNESFYLSVYNNSGINSTLSRASKHWRFPIRPVYKKP